MLADDVDTVADRLGRLLRVTCTFEHAGAEDVTQVLRRTRHDVSVFRSKAHSGRCGPEPEAIGFIRHRDCLACDHAECHGDGLHRAWDPAGCNAGG
jgi:hypothetical protein